MVDFILTISESETNKNMPAVIPNTQAVMSVLHPNTDPKTSPIYANRNVNAWRKRVRSIVRPADTIIEKSPAR